MRNGYVMKEFPGKGFRRVVASPRPLDVVEKDSVLALVRAGHLLAIAIGRRRDPGRAAGLAPEGRGRGGRQGLGPVPSWLS